MKQMWKKHVEDGSFEGDTLTPESVFIRIHIELQSAYESGLSNINYDSYQKAKDLAKHLHFSETEEV